jgi:MFS family permease
MTRETILASLIRLYPKPFRREYGEQMLDTYRELSVDTRRSPLRFWSLVFRDTARSVARERADAWTHEMRRLGLNWIAGCSLGTLASGAAIGLFLLLVERLFPTYVDANGFAHAAGHSRNLPSGVYGALIGLVIGGAQALVLRRYVRRAVLWSLATSIAVGVGFSLGFVVAGWIQFHVAGLGAPRLTGYFSGVVLIGGLVGAVQSLLLRMPARSAAQWIAGNAVAVPVALGAVSACEFFLFSASPRTWQGAAVAFAVYPAAIGLLMGVITVRPLTTLLARRNPRSA